MLLFRNESQKRRNAMADHVYKLVEIVGTSHDGHDAAVKAALGRARETIRNIR